MNCPTCNTKLDNGTWVCTETDHRILDSNGNVEFFSIREHVELNSNDEEVGDSQNIKYCFCGYKVEVG